MALTEFREVLSVDRQKMYQAITCYEDYPKFVDGCSAVKVKRDAGNGLVRVQYTVNMMGQEVIYTLDHKEDLATGNVEWTLIESNFFKKNNGRWELKDAGKGKLDVLYALDVEFKVPVPGFILNKLVKGSLPVMVKSFAKYANTL